MARNHDETDPRQRVYEVAYQAYQSGGYADIVDAVRPMIAAETLHAAADRMATYDNGDGTLCVPVSRLSRWANEALEGDYEG